MNQGIDLNTKHLLRDFFLGEGKEHLLSLDRAPMTDNRTGLPWQTMSLLRSLTGVWRKSYYKRVGDLPQTAASLKKSHPSMNGDIMKTAKRRLSFKDPAALCLLCCLHRPHDAGAGLHTSGMGTGGTEWLGSQLRVL